MGEHRRRDQAEHHQRKVLRRAELQRDFGERRRKQRDDHRGDASGEERADRRDAERGPRPALSGHLVAIEAGHDRRGLARNVDQNSGGRAAVLRAVIDPGKHDQRGSRVERESDRQQHGDGGHRPDAGQHADQRAEQTAHQTVENILEGECDLEADGEIVKEFHRLTPRDSAKRSSAAPSRGRTMPPRIPQEQS